MARRERRGRERETIKDVGDADAADEFVELRRPPGGPPSADATKHERQRRT